MSAICRRCRKVRHASDGVALKAWQALVRQQARDGTRTTRYHLYPCPVGPGWHLGHRIRPTGHGAAFTARLRA